MSITFNPGAPCAGGNHWDVAVDIDGKAETVAVTFARDLAPLTADERRELARLLTKRFISTAGNKNMVSIRAAMATFNIGNLP